jgi:hypothetical protein
MLQLAFAAGDGRRGGEIAGRVRRLQGFHTALLCAAEHGHVDCVRVLVECGADKEARNNVREDTA